MSGGRNPERPILAISFRHRGFEFVAKGMDELRLEEVSRAVCNGDDPFVDRTPAVILLETLRKAAESEGKYIRQTAGAGNYGHVKLRVEPNDRGKGVEFVNATQGGAIPAKYLAPIEEGVREALAHGALFGYEVVDARVTLIDGSYHDADSNEIAFKIAASQAFKDAARKASPSLLEPVMAVEARLLEADASTIIADINARRGRIESMERFAGFVIIRARVPLSDLLRCSKLGRPEYAMQFAGYEEARFPRNGFGDYDAGVTANRPTRPIPDRGYAAAKPDDEFDSF